LVLSPEHHTEVVRQIIDLNLTAKQVKELCEGDLHEDAEDEVDKIPAPAVKIAKTAQSVTSISPEDIARALVRQEGDTGLARARLQAMQKLLMDAELYLISQ